MYERSTGAMRRTRRAWTTSIAALCLLMSGGCGLQEALIDGVFQGISGSVAAVVMNSVLGV